MASRHFHLKYHVTNDAAIIARLEAQDSIQDYIRRLVQSDILADMLRPAFHLEDRPLSYDEWMEKNCRAFELDNCDGCPYLDYPSLGTDVQACNASSAYEKYLEDMKHGEQLQKS